MASTTLTSATIRSSAAVRNTSAGWLDSPAYDLTFVVGVAALALTAGAAVVSAPYLFYPLLIADTWLLGYHHVAATFTRVSYDRDSLLRHRFLTFGLPWIILVITVFFAWSCGIWAIATTYLYWQWWHYTRQSFGVAKAYLRQSAATPREASLTIATLYSVAVFAVLYISADPVNRFLGQPIRKLPLLASQLTGLRYTDLLWATSLTATCVGLLALGLCLAWTVSQVRMFRQGRGSPGLAMYMVSHVTIFLTGYYFISQMDHGWLVLNIWHNGQYLLFVWLMNARRFSAAGNAAPGWMSWLSQRNALNIVCYFAVTLLIASTLYFALLSFLRYSPLAAFQGSTLIVVHTINFHHYVVDTLIWRRPRRPEQSASAVPAALPA